MNSSLSPFFALAALQTSQADGMRASRYLRAVAAFYVRLTFDALNVYEVLEPLLEDYRKLRVRSMGEFSLVALYPSFVYSCKRGAHARWSILDNYHGCICRRAAE